jgi:hypothetical protein
VGSPAGHDIEAATRRLDHWVEAQGFRGWDPHDALRSPLLRDLTFGNRYLGIIWLQLLRRSPINLRPLLGVPKGYNPKGIGLFLGSYLRKWQCTGDPAHARRVAQFADWLWQHRSVGYSGACWGYNFDWPNRGFFAPAGTPTIVNTTSIVRELLLVHQAIATGEVPALGVDPLTIARSACDFLLGDLHRLEPVPDELCFSYTPLDRRYIHNASLLGASVLAEVGAATGEAHLGEIALAAARYSARRQQPDGSWRYGEGLADGWIDNFHTGFVLVCLKQLGDRLEAPELYEPVERGYRFWKTRFFEADGAPKYYPTKRYPIDAHSAAQAILTFLAFADRDTEARCQAERIAGWAIEHLQDPAGFFHYQIHARYRIKIPYIRWSQAWMQRALNELLWDRHRREVAG